MLKRNNIHIYATLSSFFASFLLLALMFISLKHKTLAVLLSVGLMILVFWIITIILGVFQLKVIKKKESRKMIICSMIFAPLIFSISNNWVLYVKSGFAEKEINSAIEYFERMNIDMYLEHFDSKKKEINSETKERLKYIKELLKEGIIDEDTYGTHVKKIVLEELNLEKLPILYSEKQIKEIIAGK